MSHFRSTSLTWERVASDATGNTIQFDMQSSFRTSSFGNVTVGQIVSVGGTFAFGDGTTAFGVYLKVLSVDSTGADYFVGQLVTQTGAPLTHQYAAGIHDYNVAWSSSNRLLTLQNLANSGWREETIVNIGSTNAPPVSSLAPIVQVAANSMVTFQVPASDPNGDTLTYKLGSAAQFTGSGSTVAGSAAPDGLTIDPNTGVITWDITGGHTHTASNRTVAVGQLWACTVLVSDGKSEAALDFVIQIVDTTNNQPPVFDATAYDSAGMSFTGPVHVQAGVANSIALRATDPNGNLSNISVLNAPQGLTTVYHSTEGELHANFTPTAAEAGQTFVVNFQAIDSGGLSTNTSVTYIVDASNTAPVIGSGGVTTINDNATTKPFAAATLTDPDAGQTHTVTVTFDATQGALSNLGGFTQTAPGVYAITGVTEAAAQAALQGLVFTPTANQVAPGASVTTAFTVTDSDGVAAPVSDSTTKVVALSVNDAPTLTGAVAVTTGDRSVARPFAGVVVSDPDVSAPGVGQLETVTVTPSTTANGALAIAGATAAGGVLTLTGTAAQVTAALQAATFTPAAQPIGAAPTRTDFAITVTDASNASVSASTSVTATHTTNTPVTGANASPLQTITDKAVATPFAGVTVTDPDLGQTETAVITYAAANGVLAGPGLSGSPGSYTLSAATPAALQAALQALVFTPTANQATPGQTVTTTFGVALSDGSATNTVTDQVAVLSVNDAPVLGGTIPVLPSLAFGATAVLQPSLTIADADYGASVGSAVVRIASGFTAGDVLSVASPQAGISSSYDAKTGVLTLTGAASDAAYQAELRSVTFGRPGAYDSGAASRTFTFTVVDDQGGSTTTSGGSLSSTYGDLTNGVTGVTGAGGGSSATGYSTAVVQALDAGFGNLIRAAISGAAASDTTSPLYAQAQAEKGVVAMYKAGAITALDAQNQLYHLVDGTTSVAEITYAFFTGKTPTQAGLNYLVTSAANTTDLNDPYYAKFTTENRYINMSVALATGGDGTSDFHAAYDSLSLTDATAKAYAAIFGVAATADKVSALLGAAVPDGLGGTETRAQYFAQFGGDGLNGVGTKAAMIGFLLADSVKEGFGTYQQADLHFLADLAHGTAVFNVDLLAAYGAAPTLVGQATLDPTLRG